MYADLSEYFSLSDCELSTYIDKAALNVVKYLIANGKSIACAESCTGGMLSQYITSVSGASKVFECSVVSYSERIKTKLLGVPDELISEKGVVSAEVALKMAEGILRLSGTDIGVGITGLADPETFGEPCPAGTIYVCVVLGSEAHVADLALYRYGSFTREKARRMAVLYALETVLSFLNDNSRI